MKQSVDSKKIETEINQYGEIVESKNNIVVMDIEEYQKKILNEKMEKNILRSEEDYNNGRVRKAEDVFKEWELKYEI